jgi:hypothetical protein
MEEPPDRLTAEKILYRVLRGAILEIRMYAVQSNNEAVVVLANLIHNMPSQLERAATDEDFRSILDEMWQRADSPGRAWLEHCLQVNLGVDPAEWGA